jgi:hypothetical protein
MRPALGWSFDGHLHRHAVELCLRSHDAARHPLGCVGASEGTVIPIHHPWCVLGASIVDVMSPNSHNPLLRTACRTKSLLSVLGMLGWLSKDVRVQGAHVLSPCAVLTHRLLSRASVVVCGVVWSQLCLLLCHAGWLRRRALACFYRPCVATQQSRNIGAWLVLVYMYVCVL